MEPEQYMSVANMSKDLVIARSRSQWKISFGFWAALGLIAYFVFAQFQEAPHWLRIIVTVILGIATMVFVCHSVHIVRANCKDMDIVNYCRQRALKEGRDNILDSNSEKYQTRMEFVPLEGRKYGKKRKMEWHRYWISILIAALLFVGAMVLLWGPRTQATETQSVVVRQTAECPPSAVAIDKTDATMPRPTSAGVTTLESWALVASIVSVIVGVLAIALAVSFFCLAHNASAEIRVGVSRLEALFDKMYKGTFTSYNQLAARLADTVLLEHGAARDEEVNRKVEEVRRDTLAEIKRIAKEQSIASQAIPGIESAISTAINESRKAEAQVHRGKLEFAILKAADYNLPFGELEEFAHYHLGFEPDVIRARVMELMREGCIAETLPLMPYTILKRDDDVR